MRAYSPLPMCPDNRSSQDSKGKRSKYASTLKLALGVFTAGSTVFTVNVLMEDKIAHVLKNDIV